MKEFNKHFIGRIVCIIAILGSVTFLGCQAPEIQEEVFAPVFFPQGSSTPRLQFLKSYNKSDDLGKVEEKSGDWFEEFIIGKEEAVPDRITRPYGMAFSEGKLYVVDLGRKLVEILDFNDQTFDYLTWDRRLKNPVDIWVDGENKYVTDSKYGAVFVFDKSNTLSAILGKKLNIRPLGVVVRGDQCYITDAISQQVVVLDKYSGEEISRMGKQMTDPEQLEGSQAGQFRLISDLALDQEGNVYVTDRVIAQIMKFDSSGRFVRFFGRIGDRKGNFVRPKGIAIDREDRIWVVDAATQVCKVYDPEGLLLLYFGMAGNSPGMMNLPATVILDYDNVELFKEYAVDGAELEFLVVITNHYGPHKVAVYGFGTFPVQETGSVPDTLERPGASEVVDEIQEPNKEQPEK